MRKAGTVMLRLIDMHLSRRYVPAAHGQKCEIKEECLGTVAGWWFEGPGPMPGHLGIYESTPSDMDWLPGYYGLDTVTFSGRIDVRAK